MEVSPWRPESHRCNWSTVRVVHLKPVCNDAAPEPEPMARISKYLRRHANLHGALEENVGQTMQRVIT
jgi:hypothetical protein